MTKIHWIYLAKIKNPPEQSTSCKENCKLDEMAFSFEAKVAKAYWSCLSLNVSLTCECLCPVSFVFVITILCSLSKPIAFNQLDGCIHQQTSSANTEYLKINSLRTGALFLAGWQLCCDLKIPKIYNYKRSSSFSAVKSINLYILQNQGPYFYKVKPLEFFP